MKTIVTTICFLLLLTGTVLAQPAWYVTSTSITISSLYGSSRSSMPFKGSADILFNSGSGAMEFEFNGAMSSASSIPWAKSLYVYCACESTVLISGSRNAVMPCQIWDGNEQEVGQGILKIKALYNTTYDRWSVTGTYYGNGDELIRGINTLDQFSISSTMTK